MSARLLCSYVVLRLVCGRQQLHLHRRYFVIVAKTSSVIQEVLASRSDSLVPATRHLVHLFDVQQSVNATLAKVGGKQDEGEHYSYNRHLRRRKSCDRGDEGEPEDKEDEYSLLLATFHTLG